MLDTLCDPIVSASSLPSSSSSGAAPSSGRVSELPYAGFLERDMETLVGYVVPEGKEGMLNLLSAKQVGSVARTNGLPSPSDHEDDVDRICPL